MRIHYVELAGFGPFRAVQTVDFDDFIDDGIFLITGKTGAGKSSILDAICFALYDAVPRYEGTQIQLRSHHAGPEDPSYVSLEFTAGGSRYRVTRTPEYERAKKSGTGTTTQKSTAELSIWQASGVDTGMDETASSEAASGVSAGGEDAHWAGLASGARNVGNALSRIVGLTKDQFLQVVLLAQNRFQEFLLAKSDERQAVLRSLFSTRRFEQYEAVIAERAKEIATQLRTVADQVQDEASRVVDLLAASAADESSLGDPADPDVPDQGIDGEPVVDPAEPADEHMDGETDEAVDADGEPADEFGTPPENPTVEWFETALSRLGDEHTRAETAATGADVAWASAEATLRGLVETHTRQRRRDDAQSRLSALADQTDEITADRRRVQEAISAAAVWPQVEARRTAAAALTDARAIEEAAREAFAIAEAAMTQDAAPGAPEAGAAEGDTSGGDTSGGDTSEGDTVEGAAFESNATAVAASIDRSTRAIGALDDVVKDEARLSELREDVARHQVLRDDAAAAVVKNTTRAAELPELLDALGTRVREMQVVAASQAVATESVQRLTTALQGAEEATALGPELIAAQQSEVQAVAAHSAAAQHLEELHTRRLAGYAGELAAELIPGDACAVCGSVEHPQPATTAGDSVTETDIENARKSLDACRTAMDDARKVAEAVGVKLAAAQARASGKGVDLLSDELAAAVVELKRATDAAADLVTVQAEEAALKNEQAALGVETKRLQADLEAATVAFSEIDSLLSQIVNRVAAAKEGFDSVAERVSAIQRNLDAARELARVIGLRQSRLETLTAAIHQLDAQLGAHSFETEEAVGTARLEPVEKQKLEGGIREWEQAGATARATLAEPALADLPEAPVDTTGASELREQASQARDSAFAARSTLHERYTQLSKVVVGVRKRLESSALLQAEYDQVRELAVAVGGGGSNSRRMRLETYVLAGQLEEIVAAANVRLRVMTGGRYELEHDDGVAYRNVRSGLGLVILDQHTGRTRPTHSLSGGETFLASLALALGLAEVVTNQAGGLTLDTLFVDEGFGSLDADTLDVAMSTLDGLRAGGRTIGLISHVGAMKEQILAHLRVEVGAQGDSHIRSGP